ncbi:glycosyltransferase [bacterium]|nr:glycosyltransferase [bacterium]
MQKKNSQAKVTLVIPHHGGTDVLRRCLASIRRTRYRPFEVLVVDNASGDGSADMLAAEFPEVRIVSNRTNRGYAGGCNDGIRAADTAWVLLLNNDTEVDPGWLGPLMAAGEADDSIAAVQPKILSLQSREFFDYSGAAGGEMDVLGYPFARGRIFDHLERDKGQYNAPADIFWASGAAVLLRKSAAETVGLLDEDFFAHMEEIDLDWRLHWAGFRVVSAPDSVVYHLGGGTLQQGSLRKMTLNHRNSLLMLLKNASFEALSFLFPARLFLELATVAGALAAGTPKRAAAAVLGMLGVIPRLPAVQRGRSRIRAVRRVPESKVLHRLYRGSIVFQYFIRRRMRPDGSIGNGGSD